MRDPGRGRRPRRWPRRRLGRPRSRPRLWTGRNIGLRRRIARTCAARRRPEMLREERRATRNRHRQRRLRSRQRNGVRRRHGADGAIWQGRGLAGMRVRSGRRRCGAALGSRDRPDRRDEVLRTERQVHGRHAHWRRRGPWRSRCRVDRCRRTRSRCRTIGGDARRGCARSCYGGADGDRNGLRSGGRRCRLGCTRLVHCCRGCRRGRRSRLDGCRAPRDGRRMRHHGSCRNRCGQRRVRGRMWLGSAGRDSRFRRRCRVHCGWPGLSMRWRHCRRRRDGGR